MDKIKSTAENSFPLATILGLLFITLKLCGVITWSWWWVLVPFWGPVALGLAILAVCWIIVRILAYRAQ